MTFRSRKLLDCAHTMPCCARFEHACAQYLGCDPAHSDWSVFGRGHGHKSPDWAFAAMCNPAHKMLDTFDRETKRMEWLRAFVATQNYLWNTERLKVA